MKKRLIALSLVLMLALTLSIPSLALLGADEGGLAKPLDLDTNHIYDVGTYTSYAFVKEDSLKDLKDKDIKWKKIPDNIKLLDDRCDFSKIIKGEGVLFLSADAEGSTTKVASMTSVAHGYIEVTAIAEKPDKPNLKSGVTFEDTATGTNMKINVGTSNKFEYAPLNSHTWTSVVASGSSDYYIVIPLKGNKQDFLFRASPTSTATTSSASPSVKFSVPAVAAAPKVTVDVAKSLVKVKKTWEYSGSPTSVDPKWTAVGDVKDITVASLSSYSNDTSGDGDTIYFRVKADTTKGKAPSAYTGVSLKLNKKDDVELDNFVMAAKGIVMVTGDVIVEYKDGTKWKKAKKLTETQLTSGLTVRIAGDKTTLASDEKTLKYNSTSKTLTLT